MALWSRSPNVHVAPIDAYDPAPYMNVADILVSDMSAVVFEFASTGKPVVWCDFLHYRWTRCGPLRYRRWKRLDREVIERFWSIAAHAARYRDLRGAVGAELADPDRGAGERRALAEQLVGPTDGRSAERVADYLLANLPGGESRSSAAASGGASARPTADSPR